MCFGGYENKWTALSFSIYVESKRLEEQLANQERLLKAYGLGRPQQVTVPKTRWIGDWQTQKLGCWFNVAAWEKVNRNTTLLEPVYGYQVSLDPGSTSVKLVCHCFLKNKLTGQYLEITPSASTKSWWLLEDPKISWEQVSHIIFQRADKFETKDIYYPESARPSWEKRARKGKRYITRNQMSKVVVSEGFKKLMPGQVDYTLSVVRTR